MTSPENYKYLSELVHAECGIVIGDDKDYLVESRLRPLVASLGLETVDQLIDRLRVGSLDRSVRMHAVECMTTNESLFFRDTTPYELLARQLLPAVVNDRASSPRLRIWSAACSSGQEPFSIAMTLALNDTLLKGKEVEIVASDISECALARARLGVYSDFEVRRGLPPDLLERFFERDPHGWRVRGRVRDMVRFERVNLIKPFPELGRFDIVFCRNVLIYFDTATKKDVLFRIEEAVAPGGFVVLGGAESALGLSAGLQRLEETQSAVYRKESKHV